jgi:hypothetical protein
MPGFTLQSRYRRKRFRRVYSIAIWTKKERLGETELTRAFDLNLQRRHKNIFVYILHLGAGW